MPHNRKPLREMPSVEVQAQQGGTVHAHDAGAQDTQVTDFLQVRSFLFRILRTDTVSMRHRQTENADLDVIAGRHDRLVTPNCLRVHRLCLFVLIVTETEGVSRARREGRHAEQNSSSCGHWHVVCACGRNTTLSCGHWHAMCAHGRDTLVQMRWSRSERRDGRER